MSGLSYSTIYRATIHLKNAKIIQIKRFPSTLLYTIDPDFIYGVRSNRNVSGQSDRSVMSAGNVLIEHNTKELSLITKIIIEENKKGHDHNKLITRIATLPTNTLEQAIKEKDNIWYANLALKEKLRSEERLVDIPKTIVDNVRKKTHFGYQQKVHKTKRDYDRKIKSKDLLRSDSKDKW